MTDVVDQLPKDSKKINIVDPLSKHLNKGTPAEGTPAEGTPAEASPSYLQQIKKWVLAEPVIHIDDNGVVKHI